MKNLKLISVQLIVLLIIQSAIIVNQLNAQPGIVKSHQKISSLKGNFLGKLDDDDRFGRNIANIGDVNGDGIKDIAVCAPRDDDDGFNKGALWILFLNSNGTVKSHQKISSLEGNFLPILKPGERFATSVTSLGDLNGDGITDIVVGQPKDKDGGFDTGAIWILFLNNDGTVKGHQKISPLQGNFTGILTDNDQFGISVASLGDLDGDGITDIAVGAHLDSDGGTFRGSVWILFLNIDGTVKGQQKISSLQGNFTGILDNNDTFGTSVSSLNGDIDGDNVTDIVVGARFDDDGGIRRGAIWILFLNTDGTVKSHQKISSTEGNFCGILDDFDIFGQSVASLGDLDGDGITDLAVGARNDDDGGIRRGAIWILFLNPDATVKSFLKISDTEGNFLGILDDFDHFGVAVSSLGDLNQNGIIDIAIGAIRDDDGGTNRGAVWILFLDNVINPISCGCVTFDHLIHTISFANIKIEGVRNSLTSKVNNAKKKFDQGNLVAAGNVLCALLNEVKAQNGKHIDPASALDIENCIITLAANTGISLPCQSGNLRLSNPSGMRFESYPNPANGSTTITFSVPETDHITLKLYNILGTYIETLFDGLAEKNNIYSLEYNTNDLHKGIYYYLLTTPNNILNKKIIIAR